MSEIKDGGPAFPVPIETMPSGAVEFGSYGMTLRDYFAAHAPKRPWGHYRPVMPAKPEPDWTDIPVGERWDANPHNWKEREEWEVEYRKQYVEQWPYFYADAMLRLRG